MKAGFPISFALIFIFFSPPTLSGVYKCKDAAGNTVYQQVPCEDSGQEINIQSRKATPQSQESKQSSEADSSISARWKRLEAEQREKADKAAEEKRQKADEKYEKALRRYVERTDEIDQDAKQFREENPQYASRRCLEARAREKIIRERITGDQTLATLYWPELRQLKDIQRVNCE